MITASDALRLSRNQVESYLSALDEKVVLAAVKGHTRIVVTSEPFANWASESGLSADPIGRDVIASLRGLGYDVDGTHHANGYAGMAGLILSWERANVSP
jgi:tRNA G26 N,N-dimethylase Trm1